MTTLVLVRHGQASFGARNYDVLSPLGERQGSLLGEHWQRCRLDFDVVFSGSMQRQRITAERMLEALGRDPAAMRIDPAFNEYDHQGLIRAYLPVVAREHPEFKLQPQELVSDARVFQAFFNHAVSAWMDERPAEGPIAESWTAFCGRCLHGLLAAAAAGERVVVFTSGGVITAALQKALGIGNEVAMRLNWRIFNASVHVFHVGRNGLGLIGYNDVAHLQTMPDEHLLTHR
ncbi:MAG: histidine phosphatase family protein [Nevskia sp.]